MTEYISIEKIPPARAVWPYGEWVDTIPEGMALEITDQLGDRSAASVASCIQPHFRTHDLPLVAMRRGERLFVARKPAARP